MNRLKSKYIESPLCVNRSKLNFKKYLIIWGIFFITVLLMGADCVYNDAVLEYIEASNPFKNILRSLGWFILKSGATLLDGLYEAVTKLLTLDFLHDIPGINQLYEVMTPISWAVISISIIVMAIMLMVFHDKLHVSEGIKSFLLSVLLIVGMPTIINTFEEFKDASVTDMSSQMSSIGGGPTSSDTVGQAILKSITVDVEATQNNNTVSYITDNPYYINAEGSFNDSSPFEYKIQQHGTMQEYVYDPASYEVFGMSYLDAGVLIRSVETGDDVDNYNALQAVRGTKSIHAGEIYSYTLDSNNERIESNENGIKDFDTIEMYFNIEVNERLVPLTLSNNGFIFTAAPLSSGNVIPLFDEYIYRYQPNFFFGIIIIAISLLAMIFAGFKITSLLFDVLFNQIFTPIALATDVTGSGRGKKMLQNLISSYIVFLVILVLLKMYLEITSWASSTDFGLGNNLPLIVVMRILIIGGAAKGMIDGPDIIPRILGIDAGIKSGMGAALATWGVAKTAGKGVKGVFRGGKAVGSAAARVARAVKPHINNSMANRAANGNSGQHPALRSGSVSLFGSSAGGLNSSSSEDSGGSSQENASSSSTASLSGGSNSSNGLGGSGNIGTSALAGTTAGITAGQHSSGNNGQKKTNHSALASVGTLSGNSSVNNAQATGDSVSSAGSSGDSSSSTVVPHNRDKGKSYTLNKPLPTMSSATNSANGSASGSAASYHGSSSSSGFSSVGSASPGSISSTGSTASPGSISTTGSTASYHGSSSSSGFSSVGSVTPGSISSTGSTASPGSISMPNSSLQHCQVMSLKKGKKIRVSTQ